MKRIIAVGLMLMVLMSLFVAPVVASNLAAFTTGDDHDTFSGGQLWIGQSFLVSVPGYSSGVSLKLFREGSPGTVTVSLRLVNASGLPLGTDLAVSTIDGDTLSDNPSWVILPWEVKPKLVAGSYALIVRAPDADGLLRWRFNSLSDYPGGNMLRGYPNGTSWTVHSGDFMFQIIGIDGWIPGDADCSGKVDIDDFGIVAGAYFTTPGMPRWDARADVNNDGRVQVADLSLVCKNFNKTASY